MKPIDHYISHANYWLALDYTKQDNDMNRYRWHKREHCNGAGSYCGFARKVKFHYIICPPRTRLSFIAKLFICTHKFANKKLFIIFPLFNRFIIRNNKYRVLILVSSKHNVHNGISVFSEMSSERLHLFVFEKLSCLAGFQIR